MAASVAAAGGVCWWALSGVDTAAVGRAMGSADVGVLAGLAAAYLGVFYAVEITGFLAAYRRHLVPDVPARHVAVVVGGKQLLGMVSPLLTKVVAPLYFRRRWDVPVLSAVGASELVGFADGVATLLLVTAAVAIGAGLPGPLVASFAGWWIVLAAYAVWAWAPYRPDRPSRLRESNLLRALADTTPRELAAQVALRLALGLASAAVAREVLAELGQGAHLGAGQLTLLGALLFSTAMLPLSVAGYGGPQGVAVLLLVEAWGVATREDALAFSLVWSTIFLVGRFIVGAALAVPLLRLMERGDRFGYPHGRPDLQADTWCTAFLAMVDAVLADAERFDVGLPAPPGAIRGAVHDNAHWLDDVAEPALVHFDLWDGNLLVDEQGALTGIVDAERAFWGDPHADFASLALFATIEADRDFLAGYAHGGGRVEPGPSFTRRQSLYRTYLYLVMTVEAVPRAYGADWRRTVGVHVNEHLKAELRRLEPA